MAEVVFEDVRKSFGRIEVLKGIDGTIEPTSGGRSSSERRSAGS